MFTIAIMTRFMDDYLTRTHRYLLEAPDAYTVLVENKVYENAYPAFVELLNQELPSQACVHRGEITFIHSQVLLQMKLRLIVPIINVLKQNRDQDSFSEQLRVSLRQFSEQGLIFLQTLLNIGKYSVGPVPVGQFKQFISEYTPTDLSIVTIDDLITEKLLLSCIQVALAKLPVNHPFVEDSNAQHLKILQDCAVKHLFKPGFSYPYRISAPIKPQSEDKIVAVQDKTPDSITNQSNLIGLIDDMFDPYLSDNSEDTMSDNVLIAEYQHVQEQVQPPKKSLSSFWPKEIQEEIKSTVDTTNELGGTEVIDPDTATEPVDQVESAEDVRIEATEIEEECTTSSEMSEFAEVPQEDPREILSEATAAEVLSEHPSIREPDLLTPPAEDLDPSSLDSTPEEQVEDGATDEALPEYPPINESDLLKVDTEDLNPSSPSSTAEEQAEDDSTDVFLSSLDETNDEESDLPEFDKNSQFMDEIAIGFDEPTIIDGDNLVISAEDLKQIVPQQINDTHVMGAEETESHKNDPVINEIRTIIHDYGNARYIELDKDRLSQIFHPMCKSLVYHDTTMRIMTLPSFITAVGNEYQAHLNHKGWKFHILLIDARQNAAMVKMEALQNGKLMCTDYLSLYRFAEGSWRIVNRIYVDH